MKRRDIILIVFACLEFVAPNIAISQNKIDIISNTKVYDNSSHAAFTSLEDWEGNIYLSFREASFHRATKTDKGVIRILRKDGNRWRSFQTLRLDGVDLRDPYFIKFKNKFLLYTTGYVSELTKKGWSELSKIKHNASHRISIWKVREFNGVLYGIGNCYEKWPLLMKSEDGINWIVVKEFQIGGNASEADIVFVNNTLYTSIRIDSPIGSNSMWGVSEYPFHDFKWSMMDVSVASPEMCLIDKRTILLAGREYTYNNILKSQVSLFALGYDGKVLERTVVDDTGTDQGYASFCKIKNTYFMSYYTGREKTSIRLLLLNVMK